MNGNTCKRLQRSRCMSANENTSAQDILSGSSLPTHQSTPVLTSIDQYSGEYWEKLVRAN